MVQLIFFTDDGSYDTYTDGLSSGMLVVSASGSLTFLSLFFCPAFFFFPSSYLYSLTHIMPRNDLGVVICRLRVSDPLSDVIGIVRICGSKYTYSLDRGIMYRPSRFLSRSSSSPSESVILHCTLGSII